MHRVYSEIIPHGLFKTKTKCRPVLISPQGSIYNSVSCTGFGIYLRIAYVLIDYQTGMLSFPFLLTLPIYLCVILNKSIFRADIIMTVFTIQS